MSITVGIYDLFAYTVPGLFYLFVIYQFLQRFGVTNLNLSNITDIPSGASLFVFVLVFATAHLLGHLLDIFAHWFVHRLLRRRSLSAKALQQLKARYPNIDIQFEAKDWNLLFTLLRERSQDHTRIIDSFEANSIMLRNICFGLFLLTLLQVYMLFVDYTIINLVITICMGVLIWVSHRRSHMFHQWFAAEIFEASLNYGKSLAEVLTYNAQYESTIPKTRVTTETVKNLKPGKAHQAAMKRQKP